MVNQSDKSSSSIPDRESILRDYYICCLSREISVIARRDALAGKANFGIIGDGKELAQVAMAKSWQKGDFRSGYYRDQTLMLALGLMSVEAFFAQLYGDPYGDAMSGGRQMNGHFATPLIDEQGQWLAHKERYNVSADVSPTAGQMARGLGLAFASKKYREYPELCGQFSNKGNEICFVTIGDASTSEGVFWETLNAACVLQAPLAVSVWDDGYGISVPKKYQTVRESISDALAGFADEAGGMDIYKVKGWDYLALCNTYATVAQRMRASHRPALIHVEEVTQQLGHSTSGDHRRYKSPERLAYETEYDCNRRFAAWIVESKIATPDELADIQSRAKAEAGEGARRAFEAYHDKVEALRSQLDALLRQAMAEQPQAAPALEQLAAELNSKNVLLLRYRALQIARQAIVPLHDGPAREALRLFAQEEKTETDRLYSAYLYSESPRSALKVPVKPPQYRDDAPLKDGFEILNACFDHHLGAMPELFAFGEDVGFIGDVNQGMRGMQQKHGEGRVFDTGIREWTIMGQAIGMAMRGLRPIAEIQYLDYLLYGISPLSDDLATLRWRSNNRQMAPAIIRTRGHRLVGVWHAGSPMGMILGSLRGMYVCVPRNMTQAAGMYNTLLQSDDPALVIECLNGYRIKERLPDNVGLFTVPLGAPETLREGSDLTLVTYGSTVRVAQEACERLAQMGCEVELIDVQTLLPFDLPGSIVQSLRKTHRLLVADEDFEGGAGAYILQQVLEKQQGYRWLDAQPRTLFAKPHRPAYAQDGDYYSKPQVEDIVETTLAMLQE
ncbi:MAG: thiamine pyrophosphate-dependent enzyme [Saprospiraceae bacterium]